MGFYSDLILRPKQAMAFSSDHPSLFRAVLFVISSSIVGVVASLIFIGEIFWSTGLEALILDIIRWVLGGVVLVLLGMIFVKIPLNMGSFTRALSMLSHVNFYGFLMFVIGALLLPVVTIPDALAAVSQVNEGVIGEEEWAAVLGQSLSSDLVNPLSIFFFLLSFIFLLYAVYGMYLAVNQYLKTTVLKSILVMVVLVLIQSFLLFTIL